MTYIKKQKSDMKDDTLYHIYAKDKCLYNCLEEEEFTEKWEMLNIMVGLMQTDYSHNDLSYVKIEPDPSIKNMNKVIMMEPAGSDSY
tara:strand:+ start:824 stop:1084 length:261 start_codon:yes stop_codon:yes gene_type:complete